MMKLDTFPKRMREGLEFIGAVYLSTEVATSPQWDWTDTYRISLNGRTVQQITSICRARDIMDGPYAGHGKVSESLVRDDGGLSAFTGPAGTGEIPAHAKPSKRRNARFREETSKSNECLPVELMTRLGRWKEHPIPMLPTWEPLRWSEIGPIPLDGATGKPDTGLKACSAYYPGLDRLFSWWQWRALHVRWLGFIPVFIHLCQTDEMKVETLLDWARTKAGESKLLLVSGIDPSEERHEKADSFHVQNPGKQWSEKAPLLLPE